MSANKVTVAGPNLRVERDVDEETALRVISVLLGAGLPTAQAASSQSSSAAGMVGGSIAELFSRVTPRSNPARIATVAYYLRSAREEPFTRERVRQGLRDAGQKTPGNFARDFDVAVRNGWIDGNEKAGYVLTASGIAAAETRFADDTVVAPKARRVRRSSPGEDKRM